jgi:hypothetical protein
MSYCRFFWDGSDVYVYESDRGIECCGCALNEYGVTLETPAEMIEHLMEHRAAGHCVPEYALEALREEAGLPLEHPGRDYNAESIAWYEAEAAKPETEPSTRRMLEAHASILRGLRDRTALRGTQEGADGH